MNLVYVQPAPALRQAFARWGVAQDPKVRTSGAQEFAVAAALFTHVPEELLLGSTVDGHEYVPAGPDPEEPGAATAVSGCSEECDGRLPPLPVSGYPEGAVPLDLVLADGEEEPPHPPPADEPAGRPADDSPDTIPSDTACPDCDRTFGSARGLKTHRRTAHATETED
ncbi:C2H2-type zinc finger protein [Streptomyces sp. H27-H5]|uniref:C2H2-type zinc finger protein n=1 Tax=Streptomyces sp. H27-H5 TaxID=2996460 RepID=UPI00226D8351|nr:C2H2-type zinc finger protein [Streptomyces sp. H27-H5]MCY0957736.1 C2H2-type zinc finger protein [Streptomyces sp. H27-H5]